MNFLIVGLACLAPIFTEGKVVFTSDFSKPLTVNTTGSNYVYFQRRTFTANDGKYTVNANKTVTFSARPFKLSASYGSSGTTDRFKTIVLVKDIFNVGANEVLTAELKTWTKQWKASSHKFGTAVTDPTRDPRLGACGLYVGDPKSYILAHFLQTDKENIPYHGRQSSGQNETGAGLGFYQAFNQFKTGVSTRKTPYTYSVLTVKYDRKAGTIQWLADGKLVWTVTSIGIPKSDAKNILDTYGTTKSKVDVAGLQVGFACWTFLDFADPLNKATSKGLVKLSNNTLLSNGKTYYKIPTSFVDPTSKASNKLFGQGAYANHAYLKVDISSKRRVLRDGKVSE